jgi:hypothetical protein
MDRRDFYFKQPVTEAELDGAFDAVEQAIWRIMTDQALVGIAQGMALAAATPTPNLTVTVSGAGYAYDPAGERIMTASPTESVDCSKDSNNVSTAVVGAGNEKWISVFAYFTRALSDPRVDGNSNTIYFVENESHAYLIVQGAEAAVGTATRPALAPAAEPNALLLGDVHRIFGQASFQNSDLDIARRQDTFAMPQTPLAIRTGTVPLAIAAMLTNLNNHITGVAGPHADTSITAAIKTGINSIFSLATGTVSSQLIAIKTWLDALADTNVAALAKAGTNGKFSLSLGTIGSQLVAIKTWIDAAIAQTVTGIVQDTYNDDGPQGSLTSSGSFLASTPTLLTNTVIAFAGTLAAGDVIDMDSLVELDPASPALSQIKWLVSQSAPTTGSPAAGPTTQTTITTAGSVVVRGRYTVQAGDVGHTLRFQLMATTAFNCTYAVHMIRGTQKRTLS